MRTKAILSVILLAFCCQMNGQSLLEKLSQEQDTTFAVQSTFKTTRISIGHSVETRKKGTSQISIASLYWNLPPGVVQNSFVVDKASMRFGLDYAFTDFFTLGLGHSTLDRMSDAFAKARLITQQPDKSWLSVTAVQAASYRSKNFNGVMLDDSFDERLAFTTQLLFARKLTRNFSLQLAPTFVYRNSTANPADDQAHFSLGSGARYKVGNHVSIVSEYHWLFNELESRETFGAFVLGVNWEVGDVILQFKLTNTLNFAEDTFITQTPRNFNLRNDILSFGFQANYILHW